MTAIYKNSLIEITDEELVFHRYYFPFGSDKRLPFTDITSIETRPPSIFNGSWRIWGGDFRTWFPLDFKRPSRDRIFIASLHNRFWRIGFTVEHSHTVTTILRAKGLLQEP